MQFFRFAGQTMTSASLILVTFQVKERPVLKVNCENIVFGLLMLNELIKMLNS